MKYLIIGGVAGGATVAARLRRMDEKADIILFERGKYVSYANCGLPYYIGGTIAQRSKLFVQTVKGFTDRFRIDIRVEQEVTAIHPEKRLIEIKRLDSGETYTETYDKLVLSPGAEPLRPNIEGIDSKKIFTLRNVPDTDAVKNHIDTAHPSRAVVVGGGFIGLEMAENLHQRGLHVDVVEMANQVMAPLDFSMAAIVHRHLTDKGVGLYLEDGVVRFEEQDDKMIVHLRSGRQIATDMVLLSIGVRPEIRLAQQAGLTIGERKGIVVNQYMPYRGSMGTSVAKIFDLTVATAGANAKLLKANNIEYISSYTHGSSHAGYYPNAVPLSIKILFSPTDGRLFGAQVVGFEGADKRIEMFAQVIQRNGTVYDLTQLEHAYAPPYSSAKDPVNMAGYVAENILTGKSRIIHWREIDSLPADTVRIDVRTREEFRMGTIPGFRNIPVDELREHLGELPSDKPIVVTCAVGLRGYLAYRILVQNGFKDVRNLSGGYTTWRTATDECSSGNSGSGCCRPAGASAPEAPKTAIQVDACGLMCPGPVMQLKKSYEALKVGESLCITATDQAFGRDVASWCRVTGAELLSLETRNGKIIAQIRKQKPEAACTTTVDKAGNKTIVVFSDDLDKALASFVIANGAAATGRKVSMFFTFWGLNVIKKRQKPAVSKDIFGRMFGWMMPSHSGRLRLSKMNMFGMGSRMMRMIMRRKRIDSLESLIQQACDNGVEMIACTMSMDVMGVRQEELLDNVVLGGVASYLERTEQANLNLFI